MDMLRRLFPDFFDEAPAAPEVADAPVAKDDTQPTENVPLILELDDMRKDDSDAVAAILTDLYAKNAAIATRVAALENQPGFDPSTVTGYTPPAKAAAQDDGGDDAAPQGDGTAPIASGTLAAS